MHILTLSMILLLITGCSETLEKLKRVGKNPPLAHVEIPVHEEHEDVAIASRKERHRNHIRKTNSLWQPGTTSFFHDSRAWRVGDILRVVVKIQDRANLNNSTSQTRSGKEGWGITNLFGKEKTLSKHLGVSNIAPLVGTNSSRNQAGGGNISRQENIATEIAALVTKVLPNGNLVIEGHQEVRVNYELREIKVAGIIRPKDISTDNSVKLEQIAEARITYGGRGVVSDVQQPRLGSQVIDIISPF